MNYLKKNNELKRLKEELALNSVKRDLLISLMVLSIYFILNVVNNEFHCKIISMYYIIVIL